MNTLIIQRMDTEEEVPLHLLLLADPSVKAVSEYCSRGICHAAYIGDEIVGIYVLIRTRPFTLELINIAVEEEYQGRGIGKKLVFDAIQRAKEEGAKVLEVGTGNSSISQLALYQRCGFRITGVDRDFFKKNYDERIVENGIECVDMIRLTLDL